MGTRSGVRGRKPKPFAQQIAEGDPRKHGKNRLRGLAAAEAQGQRGLPACPERLQGLARETWDMWAAQLALMGLDQMPDAPMLEGACVAFARAVQADEQVRASGLLVKTSNGAARNPLILISERSWLIVKAFCCEFGLSPISRTRLAVERGDGKPEQDLAKLLSQPRVKREPMIQ